MAATSALSIVQFSQYRCTVDSRGEQYFLFTFWLGLRGKVSLADKNGTTAGNAEASEECSFQALICLYALALRQSGISWMWVIRIINCTYTHHSHFIAFLTSYLEKMLPTAVRKKSFPDIYLTILLGMLIKVIL